MCGWGSQISEILLSTFTCRDKTGTFLLTLKCVACCISSCILFHCFYSLSFAHLFTFWDSRRMLQTCWACSEPLQQQKLVQISSLLSGSVETSLSVVERRDNERAVRWVGIFCGLGSLKDYALFSYSALRCPTPASELSCNLTQICTYWTDYSRGQSCFLRWKINGAESMLDWSTEQVSALRRDIKNAETLFPVFTTQQLVGQQIRQIFLLDLIIHGEE